MGPIYTATTTVDDPLTNPESQHSLPAVEEARTESLAISKNPHSGKNKRRMALIAICVTTLALIIGFSAAVAQKNRADRNKSKSVIGNQSDKAMASWTDQGSVPEPENESLTNTFTDGSDSRTSRIPQVIDFLQVRISEKTLLDDINSPQYLAARWIADQDFLQVEVPADPLNYDDDFEFVQRYIMAVFYFAMDGASWRYKAYFMSDYEVCEWNMDFYEKVPGQDDDDWLYGVQCDENGAITTIFMTANGLKGQLPAELGDLLDLDHLSLFSNEITGNFPERVKYWSSLEFLNLEGNLMTGKLPTWMGEFWKDLAYLDLGDNRFTGAVPDLTGLDYLTELALDLNKLTGSIDVFNQLPFMESLFINNNNFTGRFGDETWPALDSLITIDLGSNLITGSVPGWVYSLETVDLHDNYLNGTIAEVPEDSDFSLQFFSLYGNDLGGSIPASIGDIEGLYHLDLSDNYLKGTIPDSFYNLDNLEVLYLTDNEFGDQPFPELDSEFLRELGLGDSSLTGTIPEWLATTFTELVVLDLRDNALTGTIPERLTDLEDLQYLLLNYNQLKGNVPDFSFLEYLAVFYIDNNKAADGTTLTGSLEEICLAARPTLANMVADCRVVTCTCCKECCLPGAVECNWWEETVRLSDSSERQQFLFSEDKIFTAESDTSE